MFEENSEKEENDSEYDSLWAEAIDQLPEQTLRELLREIATEDGELQERLILLYSGQTPADAVFRWKEDLMEMVWEAEDEHEFVDYREAYGLMSDMAKASNRKQYWSVIQHLKKISKYPNGKQAAQTLARYWKEYHYNRPAMKDELRKAGF